MTGEVTLEGPGTAGGRRTGENPGGPSGRSPKSHSSPQKYEGPGAYPAPSPGRYHVIPGRPHA